MEGTRRKAINEKDPKKLPLRNSTKLWRSAKTNFAGALKETEKKKEKKGGDRLLFVDDEPSIRLTLPPLLQERGFQLQVAANVSEALTAIKTYEFDVLLANINIDREGDGFTVVQATRAANRDCVTVLSTTYPGFETAVQGIRD